jgi:glycerol-3-phosphate acyltransferase PlsY
MAEIGWSLILAYIIGSIPFGLVFVWIFTGKDVRRVESGRTGGTNAMRAAGFFAGLLTAAGDALKGFAAGWLAAWLVPERAWVRVAAALLAIIGHNYSVFLIEKRTKGGIRLRGGAGGAPALGGAIALWPVAGLIIFPLAGLIYLLVGYASVTTMSVAFFSILVFAARAILGLSPWIYTAYGLGALIIVTWALRPNLERLRNGTERVVGLRAYWQRKRAEKASRRHPNSSQQHQQNHV